MLVSLRWVMFVMLIAFTLYVSPERKELKFSPMLFVLGGYFLSNVFLMFLPSAWLRFKGLNYIVLLIDLLTVSLLVYFTRGMDSNLFMIYFLVILFAGILSRIEMSAVIAIAASLIYGFLIYRAEGKISLDSGTLLRVPFMFVSALFFTTLAQQTKKQKEMAHRAQQFGKTVHRQLLGIEEMLEKTREELRFEKDEMKVRTMENEVLRRTGRQWEQRYRTLLETSSELILTLDDEGVILSVNDHLDNLLGYSQVDWLGKYFVEFVEESDKEKFLDACGSRKAAKVNVALVDSGNMKNDFELNIASVEPGPGEGRGLMLVVGRRRPAA